MMILALSIREITVDYSAKTRAGTVNQGDGNGAGAVNQDDGNGAGTFNKGDGIGASSLALLLFYPGGIFPGCFESHLASLAALPGEASPTRAYLGTIIGHENGEGDEGEMSIPCPGDVIVLSCVVRPTLPTLPLSEWEKHYNC